MKRAKPEPYTLALEECTSDLTAKVGGKATGLGVLLQHGFAVPQGFVVTTGAYRDWVESAGLADELNAIMAGAGGLQADREASAKIQALFERAELPPGVRDQIASAYEALRDTATEDDPPVAVRSSATAEDTAEASFAGQQDTYLWITGADAVVQHVLRCWASLFTPQVIGYRARLGMEIEDLAMAVVVQRMVPAEAAGVMMTLDPVSGDRDHVYLESAFGLGEAVVRGEVGTDRFWVAKASAELARENIGTKQISYRFDADAGAVVVVDVPEDTRGERSLSPAEVLEVAGVGRAIEEAFGAPMDIEWAFGPAGPNGMRTLNLLQARPETVWSQRPAQSEASPPPPSATEVLDGRWAPDAYWSRANMAEAIPGVASPLNWSIWGTAGEQGIRWGFYAVGALEKSRVSAPADPEERCLAIFHGRPAANIDFFCSMGDRIPGASGAMIAEQFLGGVPEGLTSSPVPRRYPVVLAKMPRLFATIPKRLAEAAEETDAWWRSEIALTASRGLPALRRQMRGGAARMELSLGLTAEANFAGAQPIYDQVVSLAEAVGRPELAGRVVAGHGSHIETRMVDDLWELSRGRLDLETYLDRYGYHGPSEGEVSARVWREDPEPVLAMARRYAERADATSPEETSKDRARQGREAEQDLLAALPRRRRAAARLVLKLSRVYLPLRGIGKIPFVQSLDVIRAGARRAGVLLAEAGHLDDPEDVFYLQLDEICAEPSPEWKQRVADRKAERARHEAVQLPMSWRGRPDVTAPDPTSSEDGTATLEGIPASPGAYEGVVRVTADSACEDFVAGEILVTATTDPSWASVLFLAGALVVDIGGALSHAAVVAREMGVPCVMGTDSSTTVLRTGDRVRVDGTHGVVELLHRSGADHTSEGA
jgi:rifampicin phosphotransferase